MPGDNKKIALTITANSAQLRRDMRKAGREVKGFERQVTGLGAKMKQVQMRMRSAGIFGRGGGALRTAAGFAGVFGFTQLVDQAKAANAAITDIAITGNLSDKEVSKLKKTMYEVSDATAKSTADLGAFVATVTTMTGDAKGAASVLGDMGEIMVATGASGEALAGTYVKLTTTMGLVPKEARKAINAFRAQEKMGSVTFANIAGNIGKIMSAGGVFGAEGRGLKGAKTFGALYQIAQRGFAVGQEGESATSAGGFLRFMGQRAKRIKKEFGVDIFDKTGKARDLPTVLRELGMAFNERGEAFRTKGALIFGKSGVRTASQLKDLFGDPTGAGQKLFTNLMTKAGTTDVVGADFKRRERSAAFQFDKQLNILKNALKKHISPLFKSLAKGMKEWGPTLVKTLKFILENSKGLLKLWLGYKGVTFFRNLMAPVQGGAGGAPGISSIIGGGGAAMLPGGQVVPMGARTRRPTYGRVGTLQGGIGINGQWVKGFDRQRGIGNDLQLLRAERRWGRTRAAGRWMGGMASRYAPAALRGGGQVAGAAGMMGFLPRVGGEGQDMAANMMLMSGNPHAMAAGAGYKYTGFANSMKTGNKWVDMANKYANPVTALNSLVFDQISGGGKKVSIGSTMTNDKSLDKMKSNLVRTILSGGPAESTRDLLNLTSLGTEQLAEQHGSAGLASLRGRFGAAAGKERARIAKAMKESNIKGAGAKGSYTEEQIRAQGESGFYKRLMEFADRLGLTLKDLPKRINVNATVANGTTPGKRLERNSGGYGGTGSLPTYDPAQYGLE